MNWIVQKDTYSFTCLFYWRTSHLLTPSWQMSKSNTIYGCNNPMEKLPLGNWCHSNVSNSIFALYILIWWWSQNPRNITNLLFPFIYNIPDTICPTLCLHWVLTHVQIHYINIEISDASIHVVVVIQHPHSRSICFFDFEYCCFEIHRWPLHSSDIYSTLNQNNKHEHRFIV